MKNLTILILIIIAIILCETFAQYCIKKSNCEKKYSYLCVGLLFYNIVSILLFFSYNNGEMGIINAIWSAMSVILATTVGVIYYHEKIGTNDIIGMGLIIIGIFFIFVKGHNLGN